MAYINLIGRADKLICKREFHAAAAVLTDAATAMGDHPMRGLVQHWAISVRAIARARKIASRVAASPIKLKQPKEK